MLQFRLTVLACLSCVLSPGLASASGAGDWPPADTDAARITQSLENRWVVSNTAVRTGYETKVFERFARPDRFLNVYMGNIVYFRLPKAKGMSPAFDPDELAGTLRDTFGIKTWQMRRVGRAHVYQALWPATMRFIKIYVAQDDQAVRVSVANFRFAYADAAYVETELIQRRLAGESSSGVPALERLFSAIDSVRGGVFAATELFEPAAWAQAGCSCVPGDELCELGCLSQSINQLNSSANNFTGAANNASNSVKGLTNAANNINQTAQQLNQTAQQGIQTAQQTAQQLNKTAQQGIQTANSIDKTWNQTNQIAQEGVNVMQQMTNPLTVAALSASAVLGGMAVGVLVDGFTEAAKALWEAFTHAKEKAQRLEEYKAAVDYYTKYKSQAGEIEKELDKMMYFFDLAKHFKKNREELLDVATLLRDKQANQDRIDALSKQKTELGQKADACGREYAAGITNLNEINDAFYALPPIAACKDGKTTTAAGQKRCDEAAAPRVMKSCYKELDKLVDRLKARRDALPDSQLGCPDAITLEIADIQGMKQRIGKDPTLGGCGYEINREVSLLTNRSNNLPDFVAACSIGLNGDLLKAQSEADILDTLKKFQADLPSELDFCKKMRERLDGLKSLEYNLMAARSAIVGGFYPAVEDAAKQDEHTAGNFQKGIDSAPQALKTEKDAANAAALRAYPNYIKDRDDYLGECIHSLAPHLFGLGFMPKATDIPIVGGTYLLGDHLFSKDGNGVVERCQAAWKEGPYHKAFMAAHDKRLNDMSQTVDLTQSAASFLVPDPAIIEGQRTAMTDLQKDVVMEQACIAGAPTHEEIAEAVKTCTDPEHPHLPDDLLLRAVKIKFGCREILHSKVFVCDNNWYHRESGLVSMLNSKSEDLTEACGF